MRSEQPDRSTAAAKTVAASVSPRDMQRQRVGRRSLLLIVALLILQVGLGLHVAWKMSVTHDEYWHLPLGILFWQTADFDAETLNPPLLRMWAAIPLVGTSLSEPQPADAPQTDAPRLDGAQIGDRFLKRHRSTYRQLYWRGRAMNLLLSLVTGILLAGWAWQWFGPKSAVVATLLWTTSPNVLAHASLVTGDVGTGLFFVAALWCGWRFAQQPRVRTAVLFGVLMGAALLCKYTALILLPLSVIVWWAARWRNNTAAILETRQTIALWGLAVLTGLLTLNAGYGFQHTFTPLADYRFQSRDMLTLQGTVGRLSAIPFPVPRAYVQGLDQQRAVMDAQHPVFLDDQWSLDGFRTYYLKAFWYKLPHPTQFLAGLCLLWLLITGRMFRDWRRQVCLLLPLGLLTLIASLSSMQLGIRYLLPVFPLLFLWISQLGAWLAPAESRIRTAVVATALLLTPLGLRHHPSHLSYFNELAGGPQNGIMLLSDSNLDWGQDLYALREYLQTHQVDHLSLVYFGTVLPAELGIDYEVPAPWVPQPGTFAISVNYVQGRPHVVRDKTGRSHSVGYAAYRYFAFLKPTATVGTSILFYDVTEEEAARLRKLIDQVER